MTRTEKLEVVYSFIGDFVQRAQELVDQAAGDVDVDDEAGHEQIDELRSNLSLLAGQVRVGEAILEGEGS